jgi:mono/diheme cytochrome c family protein
MTNILRSAVFALTVLVASSPVTAQTVPAVQQGTDTYQYWCATCHGAGPGHPGTTALAAKYKAAKPGLLEERTDLTPQAIRFAVRRGVSIMPFFRKTELTDADLAGVVAYLTRTRAATPGPGAR